VTNSRLHYFWLKTRALSSSKTRARSFKGQVQQHKAMVDQKRPQSLDLCDPEDLIKKITRKELDVKPYLDYLNDKYSRLYGF